MNIGNPNEFTIRELAELAIEVTGSSSEIVYEPLPVDDPTQRQPDLTLARSLLGWEPTIPLRDGLAAHRRLLPPGPRRVSAVDGDLLRELIVPGGIAGIDVRSPLQGTVVSLEVAPATSCGRAPC